MNNDRKRDASMRICDNFILESPNGKGAETLRQQDRLVIRCEQIVDRYSLNLFDSREAAKRLRCELGE